MARKATKDERIEIGKAASTLGVSPFYLERLIKFETSGTFSPTIKNKTPGSSARGLIQFVDKTARGMGYTDSLDLVSKNPTFAGQLHNAVVPYLRPYKPFDTPQSLYMAVFYPKARRWPTYRLFPDVVRRWNPGINTVGDYVSKVDGKKPLSMAAPLVILAIVSMFLFTRKKGSRQ